LVIRQEAFEDVAATTALVGRVAANVLEESSVGMIITDGDPGSNLDNSVFGVDFRFLNSRFAGGRSLEGEAWLQQSDSEGVTGDDMAAGFGIRLPSNRGIRGGLRMSRIESNFDPALGFVRRRGVEQMNLDVGHTWRPRGGAIRTLFSGFDGERIEYLDNDDVQSESLTLQVFDIDFNSQDAVGVNLSRETEGLRNAFEISPGIVIPAGLYSFNRWNVAVRAGNQRAVGGGFFLNGGDFYDGDRSGVAFFLGWRPNRNFRTNLRYQYNEIQLPAGSFETRVVRLQLDLAFSSTLSWTNMIQYDNVSETVGINSRLHWIPQAGREAFLVLNHGLEDFDRDNNYHSNVSEATLKYTYTFRF